MTLAPESKQWTYLEINGIVKKIFSENFFQNIKICFPADMKTHQYISCLGGGAKVASNFCIACACTSSNINLTYTGDMRCNWCKENDVLHCFHCNLMFTDENMLYMKNVVNVYEADSSFCVDPLLPNTQTDELSLTVDLNSPQSIFFTSNNVSANIEFKRRLRRFLVSHGFTNDRLQHMSISTRRKHAEHILRKESEYKKCKIALDYHRKNSGIVSIIDLVPCILHFSNRMSEKILREIFIEICKHESSQKSFIGKVDCIQSTINNEIFGSNHNVEIYSHGTYRIPIEDDKDAVVGKRIGQVTLSNYRARKMLNVNNRHKLIEYLVHSEKETWLQLFFHFDCLLSILEKRDNYTDSDLQSFRLHASNFGIVSLSISGKRFCTNYWHLLVSGHLEEYMRIHRNLYRLCNESWEATNSLVKIVYFKMSQRGGFKNSSDLTSRKLLGIMKYLIRRIGWFHINFKSGKNASDMLKELKINLELYKDDNSIPIYESEDSFSDDESVDSIESECSELDNETAIDIYNEFLLEF